MNLFDKLRGLVGGRRLRNKPGGLAWIKNLKTAPHLNGRVVTTVQADAAGFWAIDPVQPLATKDFVLFTAELSAWAIDDDHLEPLRDPPHDAADESKAWLPPVPAGKVHSPSLIEEPGNARERRTALMPAVGVPWP